MSYNGQSAQMTAENAMSQQFGIAIYHINYHGPTEPIDEAGF